MMRTPRARARRALAALAFGATLVSCASDGIFAPTGSVHGQWRGRSWGLDATLGRATLHHFCGITARAPLPLTWRADRSARGTAEWPWNEAAGPDLTFEASALPDGRIVLSVTGLFGSVDTLSRVPDAAFGPVACD